MEKLAEEANEDISENNNTCETDVSEDERSISKSVVDSVEHEVDANDRNENTEEVCKDETTEDDDLSSQLDMLIKRSQNNRQLWDNFNALPP